MAKKIVIASGKGGVGKSTVTVGLGMALTQLGKKVLLIDCDTLSSLDILTGAAEKIVYDWGDVMLGRCKAQEAIYSAMGMSLMTCPKTYKGVSLKNMALLIKLVENDYDYILLDSPAGIEIGFILASFVADRGLVVSTPDSVCVRSVCTTADEMSKYNVKDIRLIINRADKKNIKKNLMLNIDSVIDMTQVQLIGLVPEDEKIRHSSMKGTIYKKGQISYDAFNNIAARIEGKNIPLEV